VGDVQRKGSYTGRGTGRLFYQTELPESCYRKFIKIAHGSAMMNRPLPIALERSCETSRRRLLQLRRRLPQLLRWLSMLLPLRGSTSQRRATPDRASQAQILRHAFQMAHLVVSRMAPRLAPSRQPRWVVVEESFRQRCVRWEALTCPMHARPRLARPR